MTNLQFMCIGAILGVVATLIYYQLSKLCTNCREGNNADHDLENQRRQALPDDPNVWISKILPDDLGPSNDKHKRGGPGGSGSGVH